MLVETLKAGVKQHVITYGTSLTECGEWVNQLRIYFDRKFPGLTTVTNSGSSGMWSNWGVENLEERVIQKNPDVVFIEFGINDAYLPYETSVEKAKENLEHMIGRILTHNPNCQVILMVMNPPINEHLEIRPKIEDYYQMYRDVATARNLLLIDHYPTWKEILDRDKATFMAYMPDGIHPNGLGSENVTTPNILAALFGKPVRIAPNDDKIAYAGYVSINRTPTRTTFDRLVKDFLPYSKDAPCVRIKFKTDAAVLSAHLEYIDKNKVAENRASNSLGAICADGKVQGSFTRSEISGEQTIDLSAAAPTGVHEYELVLPIGDEVAFNGITINDGAKLLAPDPEPKTRYVAYGDSITHGFNATGPLHTYEYLLAKNKKWQLIDFGFAGRTVVPADAQIVASLKPDIVTILLGVNDCLCKVPLADFKKSYVAAIQNIRKENPKTRLYVITPLHTPGWSETQRLEPYRQAIREFVSEIKDENLRLIEGPELIPNDQSFFPDGVHPNDAGFAAMAKALETRIK